MLNTDLKKLIEEKFSRPVAALDLGCGDKHDIEELEKLGWTAEGVDLPEVDLNNLYDAGKQFDLVYSLNVLQFIDQKENFIKTIKANLKNDGWFFIQTFNKNDLIMKGKGVGREYLKKLLNEFRDIKIFTKQITDNHPPLGEHKHNLLIAYGRK